MSYFVTVLYTNALIVGIGGRNMMLNGLHKIHIELSSKCNKNCWMCGRRKREKMYGNQNYGFMEWKTLVKIPSQVPPNTLIAFHNNGEGLMYPQFGKAVSLFKHCITYLVTNGLLLLEKSDEIISNLNIISISIIENEDPSIKEDQLQIIHDFLKLKGDKPPMTTLRFVGKVDETPYVERLGSLMPKIVRRTLHIPDGSRKYRVSPTLPEHGVCNDLLQTLAIDRFGNVSVCVRFDVDGDLIIGNINYQSLDDIWNSQKRQWIINKHVTNKRHEVPYCGDKCEYYGVPTGEC